MKAVIDTNIWLSFLIGKLLAGLVDYIPDGLLEVVTSDEQLEEIKTEGRRKSLYAGIRWIFLAQTAQEGSASLWSAFSAAVSGHESARGITAGLFHRDSL